MLGLLPATLTAEEALDFIINANGNIALAAEVASRTTKLAVQPAHLLTALTRGMPVTDIQNTFRTLMSIHLYQSVMLTSAVYEAVLSDIQPYEVAKTYTTLLNLLASITQNSVAPININLQETVLKLLPPEIRQTVVELVQNPNEQVING